MRGQVFLGEHAVDRAALHRHVVAVRRSIDQLTRSRLIELARVLDRLDQLLVL